MLIPIILFGVAAVGGVVLAALRLRDQPLPMAVALLHGGVAATALVWLILVAFTQPVSVAVWISLGLFVVVALGGFLSYSYHLRDLPLPLPLLFVHAGLAIVAYVTLLVGALA